MQSLFHNAVEDVGKGPRQKKEHIERIDADSFGFSIPNLFVIGYGVDYAERYRNVPGICLMRPDHRELIFL